MANSMSIAAKHGLRWLLLLVGWFSVILGVAGIFLPLLPTTPFLLLSAACFMRSSPRFYQWLINHPYLGKYVGYYLEGKGIPKKAKIIAITMIWGSIGICVIWIVPLLWIKIALLVIAGCVTFYLLRQPTLND